MNKFTELVVQSVSRNRDWYQLGPRVAVTIFYVSIMSGTLPMFSRLLLALSFYMFTYCITTAHTHLN